jgi:glutaryl-CoA dehydrogenase
MTSDDIGRARGTDYFLIREQLNESELDYLTRTRQFVDDEVLPVINDYWEKADFPFALVEKLAKVGIIGDGIEGYGCAPMGPIDAGLVNMELSRGDASFGTFYGVHCGLAMKSIALLGSAEQKERWLPPMARLEKIGAFALTEPAHGSDSIALETSARREGDEWVLNGRKRWIGNGSIADFVVVWARDAADGQVKGYVVEKGTPGYDARVIERKVSLRSVWNADITLTDCRVPAHNLLAEGKSFKDAGRVLAGTRNSVAWASLGHAVAAYEVAVAYAKERQQFGKPLVAFQLIQDKLVSMLCDVTSMQLICLRLGRLMEEDRLTDTIAALAKLNNSVKARDVCRTAREVLGGNGILLDYHVMRHFVDMEALYTYEGTAEIQTLIVGRDITGVSAFA